jgi:hypothetical protein
VPDGPNLLERDVSMSCRPVWALYIAFVMAAAISLPATAEADTKAARAHFQRAEAAYNLGKFHEALAGYEAAYQAKPLPGLLFNIAQCHRNLGNQERALFFYRRYLAVDPATNNRALVEKLIAESEKPRDARSGPAAAVAPPPVDAPPIAAHAASAPLPPVMTATEAPLAHAVGQDRPAAPAPSVAVPAPADIPPVATTEEQPPAFVRATPPSQPEEKPLYRRWGFWTVVGGVAAAGVTTALLLGRGAGSAPRPTGELGAIDWR